MDAWTLIRGVVLLLCGLELIRVTVKDRRGPPEKNRSKGWRLWLNVVCAAVLLLNGAFFLVEELLS